MKTTVRQLKRLIQEALSKESFKTLYKIDPSVDLGKIEQGLLSQALDNDAVLILTGMGVNVIDPKSKLAIDLDEEIAIRKGFAIEDIGDYSEEYEDEYQQMQDDIIDEFMQASGASSVLDPEM